MLGSMASLVFRTLRTTDLRLLWKFAYNFGYKSMRSVQRYKARLKRGETFPPFLYVSITNGCNSSTVRLHIPYKPQFVFGQHPGMPFTGIYTAGHEFNRPGLVTAGDCCRYTLI